MTPYGARRRTPTKVKECTAPILQEWPFTDQGDCDRPVSPRRGVDRGLLEERSNAWSGHPYRWAGRRAVPAPQL